MVRWLFVIFFSLTLLIGSFGCASNKIYSINLLPTPDIYASGLVNPFSDENPMETAPYDGILYVTDREPAGPEDEDRFYTSDLGVCLRLGIGRASVSGRPLTWAEAKRISILKDRNEDYPLVVDSIREIGILNRSYNIFMDPSIKQENPQKPGHEYSAMINSKLAVSKNKNIYIYTHGYNTNFEDPLLVASEFWHYLGHDGVFIAYSWPATEKGTAYLGDTEKAKWASRNFRLFLQYLSEETDAENIHIISYSMGTRVATWALQDLALIHLGSSPESIRKHLRIGNVLLVSSDLSVDLISNYLNDGLLNVIQTLTVYSSETDSALGASNWLYDQVRLGQVTSNRIPSIASENFLKKTNKVRIVDATRAVGSDEGNGHHYFQSSPWVSSDILMILMYNLPPEKRGLIQNGTQIWEFPEDYIGQLKRSIRIANGKSE